MEHEVIPLRRDSAKTLYRQLADKVASDIKAGVYKPHSRLPTEPELSQLYNVSRITVRQAMEHLQASGLIIRKQGKGTFVTGPFVHHELHELKGFIEELRLQGIRTETKLLEFKLAVPPVEVAKRLGTGEAALTRIRRLYNLNGAPFAIAEIYMSGEAAIKVTWEEASAHPSYSLLERFLREKIDRAELTIRAQLAGAKYGALLNISPRAPLLVFRRVSFSVAGIPLEHTRFWVHAENYEYGVSVRGRLPIGTALHRGNVRDRSDV